MLQCCDLLVYINVLEYHLPGVMSQPHNVRRANIHVDPMSDFHIVSDCLISR